MFKVRQVLQDNGQKKNNLTLDNYFGKFRHNAILNIVKRPRNLSGIPRRLRISLINETALHRNVYIVNRKGIEARTVQKIFY